jgi:hypothetical protein
MIMKFAIKNTFKKRFITNFPRAVSRSAKEVSLVIIL